MNFSKTGLAVLLSTATLWSGNVFAADCDVEYVIQPNESLHEIAASAYGFANYQLIFTRNFGKITSPSNLPVGETIIIPCIEGERSLIPDVIALAARIKPEPKDETAAVATPEPEPEPEPVAPTTDPVPATTPATEPVSEPAVVATPEPEVVEEPAPAVVEEPEPEVVAKPEPVEQPEPKPAKPDPAPAQQPEPALSTETIRLLTANGQAPYTDRSLRGGGMVTELMRLSMVQAGAEENYKIVFIDDRDSHLRDLLLEELFHAGFPWLRPRCDDLDALRKLAPESAWMCEAFEFSEPFYEYVNGFFVRKGEFSSRNTEFDDFIDRTICRPAGEPIMDLSVKGLHGEKIELVRPETIEDCFDLLADQKVDAVSGEIFAAEEVMSDQNLFADVEELPNLSLLWTVHAVAPKDGKRTTEVLNLINKGLLDLKISGQWFRVVARHLAQQN